MSTGTDNNKTCFVICPIGDEGSDIRKWSDITYNFLIKPIVENHGYKATRADQINVPGMITNQVIENLLESDLVIADLTYNNPNVFYELAIRHSTMEPYIQMIKFGQKIPFDINGMRTVFFDIDIEHAEYAKIELSQQIKSIENGEFKATNPITLAHNYSIRQNLLKTDIQDITDESISKAILEGMNTLSSSIEDIKRDIYTSLKKISDSIPSESKGGTNEKVDYLFDFMNSQFKAIKEQINAMKVVEKSEQNNGENINLLKSSFALPSKSSVSINDDNLDEEAKISLLKKQIVKILDKNEVMVHKFDLHREIPGINFKLICYYSGMYPGFNQSIDNELNQLEKKNNIIVKLEPRFK